MLPLSLKNTKTSPVPHSATLSKESTPKQVARYSTFECGSIHEMGTQVKMYERRVNFIPHKGSIDGSERNQTATQLVHTSVRRTLLKTLKL